MNIRRFAIACTSIVLMSACSGNGGSTPENTEVQASSTGTQQALFCKPGSEQVQACAAEIPNALFATQTNICNDAGSAFTAGSCQLDSCQEGFEKQGNSCVKPQICEPSSQQNFSCTDQIANAVKATYTEFCSADGYSKSTSSCAVQQCADGYVLTGNRCAKPPINIGSGLIVNGEHPRVLFTNEGIEIFKSKIQSSNKDGLAYKIYHRVYQRLLNEDLETLETNFLNLAIISVLENDKSLLNSLLNKFDVEISELDISNNRRFKIDFLLALDLVWDNVSDSSKLRLLEIASRKNRLYYRSEQNQTDSIFDSHGSYSRLPAFILAGLFVGDAILESSTVKTNRSLYGFDPVAHLLQLHFNVGDSEGYFRMLERHIAGDMTHNSALPGELGGMVDNFHYDTGEHASTVLIPAIYDTLFQKNVSPFFLHDKYRGIFYQSMVHPNGQMPRIWTPGISKVFKPDNKFLSLTASAFQDPYMQRFAIDEAKFLADLKNQVNLQNAIWTAYFLDDELVPNEQSENSTSTYFSGPGFVSMRDSFTETSVHGIFVNGDGDSRRYTDTNSFILFHKEEIVPHAGARFRFSDANEQHHFFARQSFSKNTVRIMDPAETFDQTLIGDVDTLYSGPKLRDDFNFGGQMSEDFIVDINDNTVRRNKSRDLDKQYNSGDIIRYESLNNSYTYTLGDGKPAYSNKMEIFERSFVFLNPNKFVIFDRVKSNNKFHAKVWNMHTVYSPNFLNEEMTYESVGFSRSQSEDKLVVRGELQEMLVTTILPKNKDIIIRGGERFLVQNASLSRENVLNVDLQLDTSRVLEISIGGNDISGTLVVSGYDHSGNEIKESMLFDDSTRKVVETGRATDGSASSLIDSSKNWEVDQFKGDYIRYNNNEPVLIKGNSENTIYADFSATWDFWQYRIEKVSRSTEAKFSAVKSIKTDNLDLEFLDLSVLHYFDVINAEGNLFSFAPQADGMSDAYKGQKHFGRYNISVWSKNQLEKDYFLNVIQLNELDNAQNFATGYTTENIAATLVENELIVFLKERDSISIEDNIVGNFEQLNSILVVGLLPNTPYYIEKTASAFNISSTDSSKQEYLSSDMGVIFIKNAVKN